MKWNEKTKKQKAWTIIKGFILVVLFVLFVVFLVSFVSAVVKQSSLLSASAETVARSTTAEPILTDTVTGEGFIDNGDGTIDVDIVNDSLILFEISTVNGSISKSGNYISIRQGVGGFATLTFTNKSSYSNTTVVGIALVFQGSTSPAITFDTYIRYSGSAYFVCCIRPGESITFDIAGTNIQAIIPYWTADNTSYEDGFNAGYQVGQSTGYDSGYNAGFNAGQSSTNNLSMSWLVSFANGIFDTQVFGNFTLGNLVFTMLAIAVFGGLLKLFFGG